MNELEQIKEMFFIENLEIPINLQERLENFPIILNEELKEISQTSTREKFLILTTNTLMVDRFKTVKEIDTYFKLNKELHDLWKTK